MIGLCHQGAVIRAKYPWGQAGVIGGKSQALRLSEGLIDLTLPQTFQTEVEILQVLHIFSQRKVKTVFGKMFTEVLSG